MQRRESAPPRLTAVVLSRLYAQPLPLADALQLLASGPDGGGGGCSNSSTPPAAPGEAHADQQALSQVQRAPLPPLALALPGDGAAYLEGLLRGTVAAVPPDAPRLDREALRLSQRSTQEQARGAEGGWGL